MRPKLHMHSKDVEPIYSVIENLFKRIKTRSELSRAGTVDILTFDMLFSEEKKMLQHHISLIYQDYR
jgi:hypothetical protein